MNKCDGYHFIPLLNSDQANKKLIFLNMGNVFPMFLVKMGFFNNF